MSKEKLPQNIQELIMDIGEKRFYSDFFS
ncbi:hypothetical protein KKC1_34870 [Calderihabitans maritimus]|uniref:Uncharacterized protein n=1 Tax=Calderihabitans maritimus TaxID=1246530 RepID=A0A1Z5HYH2_9FIRM|nr:hypothetical protein KKC1_34870 [Calderihabitans maritimus]